MTARIERISITLPAELVRYADREAKRLARPRSWVIAEALRAAAAAQSSARSPVIAEPATGPYADVAGELRAADQRRVRGALALSPGERLRRAGELVRLARGARPPRERVQIIAFDRFEDFWQWKQAHRVAAAARS